MSSRVIYSLQIKIKSQVSHKAEEDKKVWNMVVDTSCFLDEELRRSLKLLEGLKGTHLIIPRIGKSNFLICNRHQVTTIRSKFLDFISFSFSHKGT